MALNDQEVERQIKQMMAFIDQEATEKVEEIEQKTDEEFNTEKGRLVQQERVKIMEHYDRKVKQVELQKKIQNSNLLNQSRLSILKAKDDHLVVLKEETKRRLKTLANDPARYSKIMENLITQALCQLLEPAVVIRCRQRDLNIVKEVADKAARAYKQMTQNDIRFAIDTENFLPDEVSGGVEVTAQKGKIKCVNTLDHRLDMVFQELVPKLRVQLFGVNQNRKFLD